MRDNRRVDRSDSALAAEFDEQRHRLVGLAYRLTGDRRDAEDAVQDAWLRLARLDAGERTSIRELGAWLSTAVGRICLDRMRSASARRETYVGPWLPEPVVQELDGQPQDPLDAVVAHEDLRLAALHVLHELSPEQRLAVVLHDGFDVPFGEIAEVMGSTAASARQHAARGRRAISDAELPSPAPMSEQQRALDELLAALASRDVDAVARALHPRTVVYGDGGGKARTARRPVVGVDKVSRFAVGLAEHYGDDLLAGTRLVLVNGELGVLAPGPPEGSGPPGALAARVLGFAVRDGRAAELYDVANPDKLRRALR